MNTENNRPLNRRPVSIDDTSRLKRKVNNLIWMYAPSDLTLEKADKIACKIMEIITSGDNE